MEYLDQQIGALKTKLKDWNLLDKSLIVLVGDHGEGLGENKTKFVDRHFGHIHYLYGIYMKVPWIIRDPTMENKAERIGQMTTLLDIAPTILGRMGWKKRPYYKGRDVLKKKKELPFILEETYTPEASYDRFGIIKNPWHMIYAPETQTFELFQLDADPGEKDNVYERNKDSEETKKIQKMLEQKALNILESKQDVRLDEKSLEMLKSLGYIK